MRKYTKKLLDLVDDNIIDHYTLIRDLLNWMSESDVKQFFEDSNLEELDESEDYDPILDKVD